MFTVTDSVLDIGPNSDGRVSVPDSVPQNLTRSCGFTISGMFYVDDSLVDVNSLAQLTLLQAGYDQSNVMIDISLKSRTEKNQLYLSAMIRDADGDQLDIPETESDLDEQGMYTDTFFAVKAGQWHVFALIVYDSGEVATWLNGASKTALNPDLPLSQRRFQKARNLHTFATASPDDDNLLLGDLLASNSYLEPFMYIGEGFKGQIDEFRIYKRTFDDPEEIWKIMLSPLDVASSSSPDLLAYYKFNDVEGVSIANEPEVSSGNNV